MQISSLKNKPSFFFFFYNFSFSKKCNFACRRTKFQDKDCHHLPSLLNTESDISFTFITTFMFDWQLQVNCSGSRSSWLQVRRSQRADGLRPCTRTRPSRGAILRWAEWVRPAAAWASSVSLHRRGIKELACLHRDVSCSSRWRWMPSSDRGQTSAGSSGRDGGTFCSAEGGGPVQQWPPSCCRTTRTQSSGAAPKIRARMFPGVLLVSCTADFTTDLLDVEQTKTPSYLSARRQTRSPAAARRFINTIVMSGSTKKQLKLKHRRALIPDGGINIDAVINRFHQICLKNVFIETGIFTK